MGGGVCVCVCVWVGGWVGGCGGVGGVGGRGGGAGGGPEFWGLEVTSHDFCLMNLGACKSCGSEFRKFRRFTV